MRSYIKLFADKIRSSNEIDELIKVEKFPIDNEHTGYLYAYKTERGVHIDAGASVGTCDFYPIETMYCGHTLHEYLGSNVYEDKEITLEYRIERLLSKTIAQLDVLAPINREQAKN